MPFGLGSKGKGGKSDNQKIIDQMFQQTEKKKKKKKKGKKK